MADDRKPHQPGEREQTNGGLSRREVITGAGGIAVGAAAGTGITLLVSQDDDQPTTAATFEAGRLQTLTAAQAATLGAALARLIPSGDDELGAEEAMVWRYIDRGLSGELERHHGTYVDGLQTLDVFARRIGDADFTELSPEQQDEVLTALEEGEPPEPTAGGGGEGATIGSPEGFFQLLRQHAIQGMFGDPAYGGNADFVGWRLIGFPGIQLQYRAEQQELGGPADGDNRSTYSYENFGRG